MPVDMNAIREAMQRRQGQQGPVGGQMATPMAGGSPMAGAMQQRSGTVPQTFSPQPGDMMAGARGQLQQSRPGEAELIIKALIQRLRQNPPEGAPQQNESLRSGATA